MDANAERRKKITDIVGEKRNQLFGKTLRQ